MLNKIIVIHFSEIIRQGLQSIIKSLCDIDTILLANVKELASYREIKNATLIFLLDDEINQKQFIDAIEEYKKSNDVKIVLLKASADNGYFPDYCDCRLPINASKSMIAELLNPYLSYDKNYPKSKATELTEREIDVIKQVALGKTNKEIAEELFISFHTVISHRKNITDKLGIKSISGLTVYAILNKLIDTNTMDPSSLI